MQCTHFGHQYSLAAYVGASHQKIQVPYSICKAQAAWSQWSGFEIVLQATLCRLLTCMLAVIKSNALS